jgi:hypothetical protein
VHHGEKSAHDVGVEVGHDDHVLWAMGAWDNKVIPPHLKCVTYKRRHRVSVSTSVGHLQIYFYLQPIIGDSNNSNFSNYQVIKLRI